MKRAELEHVIRAASTIANDDEIVVILKHTALDDGAAARTSRR
jgi:hypothetical protein